jgi:hypothetical protein
MGVDRILRDLQQQRQRAQAELNRLESAIAALEGGTGRARGRAKGRGGPRQMSAAARKRIAEAQRARWERWRAGKKKS